jgi:hypothetical protein
MAMANTNYQGRLLEDGRFIPDGARVKIPVPCRVKVFIEDETVEIGPTAHADANRNKRVTSIKELLNDAREAEDSVLTDADWEEMANLRAGTNAGFSRKIEL